MYLLRLSHVFSTTNGAVFVQSLSFRKYYLDVRTLPTPYSPALRSVRVSDNIADAIVADVSVSVQGFDSMYYDMYLCEE